MATITPSATAATEVADLLTRCAATQRLPALRTALRVQRRALEVLDDQHLAYVESGWEANWQAQHERHTAMVAEINRVLAEQFGA